MVTTADDEIGTGTDADVFLQIFGEKGNTSVVELTKSGNLFESGQQGPFILLSLKFFADFALRIFLSRTSQKVYLRIY